MEFLFAIVVRYSFGLLLGAVFVAANLAAERLLPEGRLRRLLLYRIGPSSE